MCKDTIQLAYKYRLYPNKPEIKALEDTFETCRQVYNTLLNNRKYQYEVNQKSISYNIQQNYLPDWKPEHSELSEVFSQVLQNVVKRADLAFQAFFRRVKNGETPGYPRHKGKNQYKSITYTQSGFDVIQGKLHLSKIGDIPIRQHRPIVGKIKTCTIRRYGKYNYAKWYVSFTVEQDMPEPNVFCNEELGIDVGITKFVAFSNGEFIENPRFFRNEEKNLAKAQRNVKKKKHRTKVYRKAAHVVSNIHERIRNRRHNFIHQQTRQIVNKYGSIYLEELQVDNMIRKPKPKPDTENPGQYLPNGASAKAGLNKSIADVSWSMFRQILTYKAENAGGIVTKNNPAYTSQMCSKCGHIDKENRKSQAVFNCVSCGHTENADTNAAKNQITKAHSAEVITVGHYSLAA